MYHWLSNDKFIFFFVSQVRISCKYFDFYISCAQILINRGCGKSFKFEEKYNKENYFTFARLRAQKENKIITKLGLKQTIFGQQSQFIFPESLVDISKHFILIYLCKWYKIIYLIYANDIKLNVTLIRYLPRAIFRTPASLTTYMLRGSVKNSKSPGLPRSFSLWYKLHESLIGICKACYPMLTARQSLPGII